MAKHPKRPASRASFRPIGFLGASTPSAWSDWVAAFVQRLRDGSSFDHLVGHHFASAESQLRDVEEAARGLALKIRVLHERVNPIAHQTADFGELAKFEDRRSRRARASSNSQMGGDPPMMMARRLRGFAGRASRPNGLGLLHPTNSLRAHDSNWSLIDPENPSYLRAGRWTQPPRAYA